MRKKVILILSILIIVIAVMAIGVGCEPDDPTPPPEPPTPPSTTITREDCDLVFGSGGIAYAGTLAPVDSDPAIGGPVKAVVKITATGAKLTVEPSIIKIVITLKNGGIETLEDAEAIAKVLTMDMQVKGATDLSLESDAPTDCTFTFTMPATDDMRYVGAAFAITARLTVTHADGEAV